MAVLVDETLPVQCHQEGGRLNRDECVVAQIGGLIAGRQVATHRSNLVKRVVLLTMEHNAHQKGTFRHNRTGAAFIETTLTVHPHCGDTLGAPPSCHLVCKEMPHKDGTTKHNPFEVRSRKGPINVEVVLLNEWWFGPAIPPKGGG